MIKRPFVLSAQHFIVLVSFYFAFVLNNRFWDCIQDKLELTDFSMVLFAISLPLFIFVMQYVFFSLIVVPKVGRFLVAILLIVSAVIDYAMVHLGIVINAEMIRNFVETNAREATDLVTLRAIVYVSVLGVLPALFVLLTRLEFGSFKQELKKRVLYCLGAVVLLGAFVPFVYKEYVTFGRNNSSIRRCVVPFNYIFAIRKYYRKSRVDNHKFVVLDEAPVRQNVSERPRVLVLIVGETARAVNFSLNGYEHETNPLLSKQDIINFRDVTSCGTSTAISLPCLFAVDGKSDFKVSTAPYTQNLMDIIKASGYQVYWKDNDDGCKGVCARVENTDAKEGNVQPWCFGNYCHDDILLDGLDERVSQLKGDAVIVLHTMGSHGPTYYKRYPKEFEKFLPVCNTADLQKCSAEEIVNTYNNTIVYTDYIISSVIDILKKYPELDSGMLYVSDHGESLGEKNMYLHGLPYAIAPDVQKKVPMVMWLSGGLVKRKGVDVAKLKQVAETEAYSHDNYYHTVLGILDIASSTYKKELDILR